ncbi:DUF3987 domain-containing protein [Streptomyces sp. NPDC016459]|uniref:DUF3987 domain-containing protein n=1 Tax=Streptomyces sp. NPDC016459 TaxID=3157190 RepID=UPI0033EAC1F5
MQISTADFFTTIYGSKPAEITFITSPGRNSAGKIVPEVHARIKPKPMYMPHLLSHAAKGNTELFFAPVPMSGGGMPSEATAQDAAVISSDVDHEFTEDQQALIERLDATVNESGGPGRHHVYVPLDTPHPPSVIKELNQALRVALGGDSKQNPASFLRVPGSYNRKGEPVRCRTVRLSSSRQTLSSVAQALRMDGESITAQSRVTSERETPTGALSALPSIPEGFKVNDHPFIKNEVRKANQRFGQDPSYRRYMATYPIVMECIKRGLSVDVAYAYAMTCEPLLDKQEEENGYSIQKDVARIWRREAGSAPAVPHQPETAYDPEPEAEPVKDDEFWNARPYLSHIRDFSRSRLVSPWAVLGIVLARVAGWIPPGVTLPPTVGTKASLNLFVALADDSGLGKGTAVGTARDCIETRYSLSSINLGSGEGIGHQFMERKDGELHQHTEAVMFMVNEIDSLTAMQSRSASTITPTLCSAWVGEPLGFAYVDKGKRLPMNEHTYRLTLVCGVQPKRARSLLDAAGSGLPQRFLWFPARDLDAPDDDLPEPAPLSWALPTGDLEHALNNGGQYSVPISEAIRREIRKDRSDRMRGRVIVDELDSHRNLSRLKAAAILAFLDGRAAVSDEDWDLSGVLMGVSDATRDRVVEALKAMSVEEARSRGKLRGAEQIAASEEVHKVNDAEDWAWNKLKAEGSVREGELKRRCPARFKDYLPEALARLERDSKARREQGKRKDSVSWIKL